jgi:WD40 repeat protein
VSALLAAWRAEKDAVPEFVWMRALRPPPAPDAYYIHGGLGPVKGLAWFKTQQQERILAASTINDIRFWDSRTFQALPGGYADGRRGLPILCGSPDGQHLLFNYKDAEKQGWIAELTLPDDKIVLHLQTGAVAAAYAPESRRFAIADWDGSIATVNPDARRADIVLAGAEKGPITALAWSADGLLAYFALLGEVTKVRRLADGEELTPVFSKQFVSALAWSPDGKRLAVASGRDIDPVVVIVYELDRPWLPFAELAGYDSEIQSLAWSPASNAIAAGLESGIVVIRNVAPQTGAGDSGESPGEVCGLGLLSGDGELRIHVRRLPSSEIWDAPSGTRIWVSPKNYYYPDPPDLQGPPAPLTGERWRCLRAGPYTGIARADGDAPRMWLPIAVQPGDKDGWLTVLSHETLAAAIGTRLHLYRVEGGTATGS